MQNINKLIKPNESSVELLVKQDGNFVYDVSEGAELNLCFVLTGQEVNLNVRLIGDDAKVNVKAVYLSSSNQNNKLNFCIEHLKGKTYSTQLIKGCATGFGQTDFYGIIKIPQNSQKCEGAQTHKGLLLSDEAVIKATPELEIYADDVKCSHGSSVGNLDEFALFYLMSRGIDEKTANQMLIKAFLLSDMPQEVEQFITEWIQNNE